LTLLGRDRQTYMPPKGVAVRSGVRGLLSKKQFELLVSDELGKYLAELRNADGLSDAGRPGSCWCTSWPRALLRWTAAVRLCRQAGGGLRDSRSVRRAVDLVSYADVH
jgi:aminoglycoside phosphotransferase (APT) family kinase protein